MPGEASASRPWRSSSPNGPWQPPPPALVKDAIVALHVAFDELAIRSRVKHAGAAWNPERRLWELRYDRAIALGLIGRIVPQPASTGGCPASNAKHPQVDALAPST
jgi:hypothetical protein